MRRLALLLALAVGGAAPAAACDCVAMGLAFQADEFDAPDRMLALLAGHDEVFAGRVAERVPFEGDGTITGSGAEYVFGVGRRWRGGGGDRVVVANDGWNCSYAPAFDEGVWFLVFARRSEDGRLVTEMCATAPPLRLGYVADDWTAGYAETGRYLGLDGDLFARLDAASARLVEWPSGGGAATPPGSDTALTVTVADELIGAPVRDDDALSIGVTRWMGGVAMESGEFTSFRRLPGAGPALFRAVLPPGVYTVSASHGDRRGSVGVIATGGERVLTVSVRRPPAE